MQGAVNFSVNRGERRLNVLPGASLAITTAPAVVSNYAKISGTTACGINALDAGRECQRRRYPISRVNGVAADFDERLGTWTFDNAVNAANLKSPALTK